MNYLQCLTELVENCPLKLEDIAKYKGNLDLYSVNKANILFRFDTEIETMIETEIFNKFRYNYMYGLVIATDYSLRNIVLEDNKTVIQSYVLETGVMLGKQIRNKYQYLYEIKVTASKRGISIINDPPTVKAKGDDNEVYHIIRDTLQKYYSKDGDIP